MSGHRQNPSRHLGFSLHSHSKPLSSNHLVTYLLSMRADGTLGPRETLHTGKEKSQGPPRVSSSQPPHSEHERQGPETLNFLYSSSI